MAVHFSVYTAEYLNEIIIHEKNDMKTGQPDSMTSICQWLSACLGSIIS